MLKIEGNLITEVREQIVRTMKLDDFMVALQAKSPIVTPCLPLGCRSYRRSAGSTSIIVEQPPQVRTLTWHGGYELYGLSAAEWRAAVNADGGAKFTSWRLAFPYCVFVFNFGNEPANAMPIYNVHVFYRNKPLSDADSVLYRCSTANVDVRGRICIGEAAAIDTKLPIAERCAAYIASFWNGGFNLDLLDNFYQAAHFEPRVVNLTTWATESAKNPLFVLEVPWRKAYDNPAQLIGE